MFLNEIFFILKAALEGALAKKIGTYISLSEQELVDCSTTNLGCSGGLKKYKILFRQIDSSIIIIKICLLFYKAILCLHTMTL